MARNRTLPTRNRPIMARPVAANQLIPYLNQATGQLEYMTPATLAARQREDARLYARWTERRQVQRQRDRKVRRFWLGFGVSIGLAVLLALLILGWLVWTVLGLGVLAVPLVIAGVAGLAVGGHRCITIVQHWH
jgi:Flp pilus assembly protein TadB